MANTPDKGQQNTFFVISDKESGKHLILANDAQIQVITTNNSEPLTGQIPPEWMKALKTPESTHLLGFDSDGDWMHVGVDYTPGNPPNESMAEEEEPESECETYLPLLMKCLYMLEKHPGIMPTQEKQATLINDVISLAAKDLMAMNGGKQLAFKF